jgi:hypothetical protein
MLLVALKVIRDAQLEAARTAENPLMKAGFVVPPGTKLG